ncbi:MAG: hypothetical protein PHI53_03670 [Candidatus Pacebacteria bacterium]|nr:hypothetical protein [Candidatus Paceibacterota bacterium]
MIKTGKIWHSPLNVYWHIQELTKKVGAEAIENKSGYKSVREARIGAVMALVMFQRMGKPTYVQLYKPDPPDIILMQPSRELKGQLDIVLVEVTSFIGDPKESLLEQLKRTKTKPGIHTLSGEYILVVNVGIGLSVEYKSIKDYLNENNTPFPVWAVQQISSYPDTIAKVVIINPEIYEMNVNVGEAAYLFGKSGWPDVLHTVRVVKKELVRLEKAEKFYQAPWETVNR